MRNKPNKLRSLIYWDHFCACLQFVQIVRPLLHHLSALGQMRCAVVGATIRIAHSMGELVFDVIRSDAEPFVQNRPCYSSEPCPVISSLSIPERRMAARTALSLISRVVLRALGKT